MELELARQGVINTEDMTLVSDGSNPRLLGLAESDQRGWHEDGNGCLESPLHQEVGKFK